MPDVCAIETLDALAAVGGVYVATYVGEGDDTGFTLVCLDDETSEVTIVHVDTLMDAVVELGERTSK